MKVIVTGGWASGTTAMAQALNAAGLSFPGPHAKLRDDRNPISYENIYFRQAILSGVDEASLRCVDEAAIRSNLVHLRSNLQGDESFKLPAASFVLPLIEEVLTPELFVVMTRPEDQQDRTNERRGWPKQFGSIGARACTAHIAASMAYLYKPVLFISFRMLREAPELVLQQIGGLLDQELNISEGAGIIRS